MGFMVGVAFMLVINPPLPDWQCGFYLGAYIVLRENHEQPAADEYRIKGLNICPKESASWAELMNTKTVLPKP